MNIPDIRHDPLRDPELAEALGAAHDGIQPDWIRLHASVMARAELSLARLRVRPRWWDYAARWARPAIPAAVAASIALVFLFGIVPDRGASVTLPFLDDVLTAAISDSEYELLVADASASDALLRLAMEP
jgi:hypothetical protein